MSRASLLKKELEKRGLRLNSPASDSDIDRLQSAIGGDLSPAILDVFSSFDGFNDDFDEATFISVWSINHIINNIESSKLPYVPFADRSFNAEIFRMCATDENQPILDEYQEAFPNYIGFWEDILRAGKDSRKRG